jgi:hypothetical protein
MDRKAKRSALAGFLGRLLRLVGHLALDLHHPAAPHHRVDGLAAPDQQLELLIVEAKQLHFVAMPGVRVDRPVHLRPRCPRAKVTPRVLPRRQQGRWILVHARVDFVDGRHGAGSFGCAA